MTIDDQPRDDTEAVNDHSDDFDQIVPASSRKWPTVLGTISIVYGALGFTCAAFVATSPLLTEFGTRLSGMDLSMPPVIKVIAAISGVIMLMLGLLLLVGGIKVAKRKPEGVKLLKSWAVLRLVVLVISFVITVLSMPTQLEFQRKFMAMQAEQLREAGREDLIPDLSDEQLWNRTMIQTAITSGLTCIYPLFLGFYLSRKSIDDEIETWAGQDELL